MPIFIIFIFMSFSSVYGTETNFSSEKAAVNHILYLMYAGQTSESLECYEKHRQAAGVHDFELIENLGLIMLDQGFRTSDSETQLMTLFGAGVSANERSLYIIEENIQSREPELQLIALNFLGRYHNDRADMALRRAMTSHVLLARLEAVFQLAKNKDPKAVGLIEGLMARLPEALWPVFPQLFAISGTPESKRILRKFLAHSSERVRVAAINSIVEFSLEDFLPVIRRLASQDGDVQQEACAKALGALHDETSALKLMQMANSPHVHVQLSALYAMYQLGRKDVRVSVEKIAKSQDLFAIALLGKMPGSEDVLVELLNSNHHLAVHVNAANALLELKDPRCLKALVSVLIRDARDLAVLENKSSSLALSSLKIVPSARQNFKDDPVSAEISLHIREEMILKSVELPEKDFIQLAHTILELEQNDLMPVLMQALESLASPRVIELLKKHQQKVGAPLVRNYCNLSLYRLKQQGPYADNLREWVIQQHNVDLIQFRPIIPVETRENVSIAFQLTPQETSRLLVEAFEAFVSSQDDKGIDILISVIQKGNSKNKYALIGLLLHAIQ